jgi:uncharacterized membrane protein YpjA
MTDTISDTKHIQLSIPDETSLFDQYSNKTRINKDIITYLEQEIEYISPEKKVIIEMTIDSMKNGLLARELILAHLKRTFDNLSIKDRRYQGIALILTLAGMVVFSVPNIFQYVLGRYALKEVFVVVSWVLIWRAVEYFFFMRTELKLVRHRMLQLYHAEYKKTVTPVAQLDKQEIKAVVEHSRKGAQKTQRKKRPDISAGGY